MLSCLFAYLSCRQLGFVFTFSVILAVCVDYQVLLTTRDFEKSIDLGNILRCVRGAAFCSSRVRVFNEAPFFLLVSLAKSPLVHMQHLKLCDSAAVVFGRMRARVREPPSYLICSTAAFHACANTRCGGPDVACHDFIRSIVVFFNLGSTSWPSSCCWRCGSSS